MSSPFKFPAWDLFLGGQELLWSSSWLEMPCLWCVMNRKGRGLPWLGPGGGGLEMWSKLECVLEPGTWKAALAESTSLHYPCLLQEPSGCHSPSSSRALAQHTPVCDGTLAWSLPLPLAPGRA